MKIKANEQTFQSVYIDPEAKNWEDKIVFHTPFLECPAAGISILNSLRLETKLGLVLASSAAALRSLIDKIKKSDEQNKIGKRVPIDILAFLVKEAILHNIEICYIQGTQEEKNILFSILNNKNSLAGVADIPQEVLERLENIHIQNLYPHPKYGILYPTLSFFDPLTKRRIVKYGPKYFDESLPSLEDFGCDFKNCEESKKEESKKEKTDIDGENDGISVHEIIGSFAFESLKVSPSTTNFPPNISERGKIVWKLLLQQYKGILDEIADRSEKWKKALDLFVTMCKEMGIAPYELEPKQDKKDLKKDIKETWRVIENENLNLYEFLTGKDFITGKYQPKKVLEVYKLGDAYFLTFVQVYKLSGLASLHGIIDALSRNYYYVAMRSKFHNAVKRINHRTTVTVSDYKSKPQTVGIYSSIRVLEDEASSLLEKASEASLMKLADSWAKTGKV